MARSIKRSQKPRHRHSVRGLTPLTGHTEGIENLARDFSRRDDSPLQPQTDAQATYIRAITGSVLTFGMGPAGTGKTFIAASLAAEKLIQREVDRIIITRPAVEAGEELGFLPGELHEKFAPYRAPVRQVLERRLGRGAVEMFLKNEKIVILPLAHMRGWTFENAFVLLDEAQNTTPTQMKLFLTRIGEGSCIVVDGDATQRDVPGPCGLLDGLRRVKDLDKVSVVCFTKADVVRSGLTQQIVEAYENEVAEEDRAGLEKFLGAT